MINLSLPELLTGSPVICEDRLRLGLIIGGGQEDAIPHYDWRGMTATRDFRFPDDIGGFIPLRRGVLSGGRDSIGIGTTPGGPVAGPGGSKRQKESETEKRA